MIPYAPLLIPDRFRREQEGIDALQEGQWLILQRGGRRVDIPVRVTFGPPEDPETGAALDRPWRWRIFVGGYELDDEPVRVGPLQINDLSAFWPSCLKNPIDDREYDFRLERQAWAAEYDPLDPFGSPGGRIDPLTAPLPFLD